MNLFNKKYKIFNNNLLIRECLIVSFKKKKGSDNIALNILFFQEDSNLTKSVTIELSEEEFKAATSPKGLISHQAKTLLFSRIE